MEKIQAKSSCCGGKIIRFGERRRRCLACKKTWRIRKKKRGRKTFRVSSNFLKFYLDNKTPSLYALARKGNRLSEDQLNRRLIRSLQRFVVDTPWPAIPEGELIAIADAMIITIDHKTFTFYFILLRPINSIKAIITPFYCKEGSESWLGWQEAFRLLTIETKASVCALVSDGHNGLISVAKQQGWIIQRCNFHIIAKIQGRRSRWARSRHREMGEKLYQLLNIILTNRNEIIVQNALLELFSIRLIIGSPQLKLYLSGFLRHYEQYRSYLIYPKLHLPRTSNSAESLIGQIRKLCNRAHGFRTLSSLTLWITALVKFRKIVTCNGTQQPN